MSSKIVKCSNCDKEFSTKQALDYHLKKAVCTSKENSENILSHITIIENLVKKVEELTIDVATLKVQMAKQQEIIENLKKGKGYNNDKDDDKSHSRPKIEKKEITFKYETIDNVKYGKIIRIKNFTRFFVCKEEVSENPCIWGWAPNYEEYQKCQEIDPISTLTLSTRNILKETYGIKYDEKEYDRQIEACKDKRNANTILQEIKDLSNLGISGEELDDVIKDLGNQLCDGEYSKLEMWGIGRFSFKDLFPARNKYIVYKNEYEYDVVLNDDEKKKYILNLLKEIDSYYVMSMNSKYLDKIYIFFDEVDLIDYNESLNGVPPTLNE